MSIELSIIIVSHNVPHLLRQCLRSIYTYPPEVPFEIWVVDNASTEGNVALVQTEFPQVRLIANPENRGFPAANNQALRLAQGELLLLLNPDTEVRPGTLTALCRRIREHPEIGALGCLLLWPDAQLYPYRPFPDLWEILLDFAHLGPVGPDQDFLSGLGPRHEGQLLLDVDIVCGACFLTRRTVLDQVGLMDEGYFVYCEDTDWCWRMKQAGWRVAICPDVAILHHEGQGFAGQLARRGTYYESLVHFFRQHYPWGANLALRSGLAGMTVGKWLVLLALRAGGRIEPDEAARRGHFFRRVLRAALMGR